LNTHRTILALFAGSSLCAIGASDSVSPPAWITTNATSHQAVESNYFEEIDLTPSVSTKIPNASAYSSSAARILVRNREGLVVLARACGYYGGRLMANYDVRTDGSVKTEGMTQGELYKLWQTNQTLFRVSYYRGRVFYTDRVSRSDEWITVFSSEDKRHVVFARDSGPIFFSENAGVFWTSINKPGQYEFTLSASPKGTVLVAALSFTNVSNPNLADEKMAASGWYSAVSAADGSKLVLTGGSSQSAPILSITPSGSGVVVSWPAEFTSFVLQENRDLASTNWVDATNAVNTVGEEKQVNIPSPSANNFYRLRPK
jgi:hypothetical protein